MPWPWMANVRDESGAPVELAWTVADGGRWSAVNTSGRVVHFAGADGVGVAAPGEVILGPGRPPITQI